MLNLRIPVLLFLLIIANQILAQDQPASLQSNYAGINSVPYQPANISDSRYVVDINLFSFNMSFYNNYLALRDHTIGWYLNQTPWQSFESGDTTTNVWQDPEFQDEYLFERLDGRTKSVHNNIDIMLPSFLVNINEKNAVSFNWRVRSIMNIDGLGSELAQLIYHDLDVPQLWSPTGVLNLLHNPDMGFSHMSWAEYGIGYGRVLYDEHKHFMKAGINVKMAQGINAMYLQMEEFDYSVQDADTISIFRRRVNYGRSESWDPARPDQWGYRFDSKPAPGVDIGFIYEFRPNREKYKYDMDNEYDLWMNNKNKYKLKLGLSITDIGRLKFKKNASSHDFIADTAGLDRSEFTVGSVQELDNVFQRIFEEAPGDQREFTMSLPTAISIQIDYNVWNDFYLNLTPYIPIYNKHKPNKIHNISSVTLAPRYDHRWFGLTVPFSYNGYGNSAIGLTARLGPFTLGTTNVLPYVTPSNIYGLDMYFALKVPIFRKGKPKDRDEDKVSDRQDDCPEVAGEWVHKGCPDTDKDGIPDFLDDCPADSGLAEFKGCPDTDGDGIIDKFDECISLPGTIAFRGCPDTDGDSIIDPQDTCPSLAGLRIFHGCPDTDGDSIIDPEDLCPEYAGPVENGGCPDRDNDGIFDYLDECPEKAGPSENNGCPWPDTDLDGILDKEDRCPNNPGPRENYGCPYTDTDGDSILDKDDDCPNVPGVIENNGCPVIEEEEQEIINTAFSALEFLSGKDVIRDESFSSLDELATLLIKKADWKLRLSGHTDDVGAERDNLILSKRRAEAVQKYLTGKGVENERISVEFYGETKPIADNDTPEGRQKNRRVEMKILFE